MEPNGEITKGKGADPTDLPPNEAEKKPGVGASISTLFATKLKILSVESKIAVSGIVRVIVLFAAAALLLLFTWILAMAGLIGVLVEKTDLTWFYSALIIAGAHLLIAIILALVAKAVPSPSFEHTSAEFQKDKEWLNQLKNKS